MIQLNLVPDVKQELIRAQRSRALVISGAILVSIVAGAIVTLLALYVFVAQTLIMKGQDDTIKAKDQELHKISGLEETLTIQNQLTQIVSLHDSKGIDSRLRLMLGPINPASPNDIKISKLSLDSSEGTITIEAQAVGGYPAFETFKKTLQATKFNYTTDTETKPVTQSLISPDTTISEGSITLAKSENGTSVLQFTVSFTYSPEFFARASKVTSVSGPALTNATDSFRGLPKELFTTKATSQENQ